MYLYLDSWRICFLRREGKTQKPAALGCRGSMNITPVRGDRFYEDLNFLFLFERSPPPVSAATNKQWVPAKNGRKERTRHTGLFY